MGWNGGFPCVIISKELTAQHVRTYFYSQSDLSLPSNLTLYGRKYVTVAVLCKMFFSHYKETPPTPRRKTIGKWVFFNTEMRTKFSFWLAPTNKISAIGRPLTRGLDNCICGAPARRSLVQILLSLMLSLFNHSNINRSRYFWHLNRMIKNVKW